MLLILIQSVDMLFTFLRMVLLARIILSWLAMASGPNALFQFVYNLTEPFLVPIRRMLAKSPLGGPGMMIDFSVLILFILIQIGQEMVINLLWSLS